GGGGQGLAGHPAPQRARGDGHVVVAAHPLQLARRVERADEGDVAGDRDVDGRADRGAVAAGGGEQDLARPGGPREVVGCDGRGGHIGLLVRVSTHLTTWRLHL